jgi:hypothetical protein
MEKTEEQKDKPDKKTVKININGTPTEWPKDEISFDEVIDLAFPGHPNDPNIIYKVTYERAHGNKDGILN